LSETNLPDKPELNLLKQYAKLLDSKFRFPGTDITFGIDPLIGMIPGVGDIVGYGFSVVLLISAFRKGVKGEVLIKMLGNIGLDTLIGMVPVLGTIFDFVYKANDRNYQLLNEFVEEDKHAGSGWPYIIAIVAILIVFLIGLFWLAFSIGKWIVSWF